MTYTSALPDEIARFERIAAEWWNPEGKFKPLHQLNPLRIGYIREQATTHFGRDAAALRPLKGLRLLDVGCGGGLVSEPLSRIGADVTGIDASEKNVAVASLHAERSGAPARYRAATVESLLESSERFDIVLSLEIVEHVTDPARFMADCAQLVAPGGMMFVSTLNRTVKSLLLAKFGAEYVLRWLPRGTHDWRKFLRPSEVWEMLEAAGIAPEGVRGMTYNPVFGEWSLSSHDVSMNYLMYGLKR